MIECSMTYGAIIALAGALPFAAFDNQPLSCFDNSLPARRNDIYD